MFTCTGSEMDQNKMYQCFFFCKAIVDCTINIHCP